MKRDKKTREVQILNFNFDAFRRLGNKSADCSEMLAETHEINHRRRHWAPFQNRNVTTERAPPSSDDESRTSRIAGFLSLFFATIRIALYAISRPETLKTSLWKENLYLR